jgi:hypothetical protein
MVVLGIEDGKVIKVVEVSARLRVRRDLKDFWGADLTKRSLALQSEPGSHFIYR